MGIAEHLKNHTITERNNVHRCIILYVVRRSANLPVRIMDCARNYFHSDANVVMAAITRLKRYVPPIESAQKTNPFYAFPLDSIPCPKNTFDHNEYWLEKVMIVRPKTFGR